MPNLIPSMRFLCSVQVLLVFTTISLGQNPIDQALEKYNKGSVPYIQVAAAASQDAITFLDARKLREYEVSHLQDAIWVGYEDFDGDRVQAQVPKKDTHIIIYCSIGVRSEQIGERLQNLGYTQVKNLYGGIFEWKNKGYPVYDGQGRETEKVHAFDAEWGKLLLKGEKILED